MGVRDRKPEQTNLTKAQLDAIQKKAALTAESIAGTYEYMRQKKQKKAADEAASCTMSAHLVAPCCAAFSSEGKCMKLMQQTERSRWSDCAAKAQQYVDFKYRKYYSAGTDSDASMLQGYTQKQRARQARQRAGIGNTDTDVKVRNFTKGYYRGNCMKAKEMGVQGVWIKYDRNKHAYSDGLVTGTNVYMEYPDMLTYKK